MISESMRNSVRAKGLGALMKGAGLLTRFIPIPQPTLLVGPGSSVRLGQAIAGFGHRKILIVTDSIISKLGLLNGLTDALTAGGAQFVVFDEITPDAPIPLVQKGIDRNGRHLEAPDGPALPGDEHDFRRRPARLTWQDRTRSDRRHTIGART